MRGLPLCLLAVLICYLGFSEGVIIAFGSPEPQSPDAPSHDKSVIELHLRRHGLCNRLRSLAAAVMLSEDLGSRLLLDWQPEASCNATFRDLFSRFDRDSFIGDVPIAASAAPPLYRQGEQATRITSNTRGARVRYARPPPREDGLPLSTHIMAHQDSPFIPVPEIARILARSARRRREGDSPLAMPSAAGAAALSTTTTLHLTSDTPNIPEYLSCGDFASRKGSIYRSLVPTPFVRAAHACVAAHLRAPRPGASATPAVLGMHVRVFDGQHDYPVVPNGGGGGAGASLKANFGDDSASPLGAFAHALEAMALGARGAGGPLLRDGGGGFNVLLVTNDCSGRVERELAERLARAEAAVGGPLRILTIPKILQSACAGFEYAYEEEEEEGGSDALNSAGLQRRGKATTTVQRQRRVFTLSAGIIRELLEEGYCPPPRQPGSEGRRGIPAARAALLDWWTLGLESDAILGSYWSSFSEEAALLRGVPYVTIAGGGRGGGSILAMLPAYGSGASHTCAYPPYINDYFAAAAAAGQTGSVRPRGVDQRLASGPLRSECEGLSQREREASAEASISGKEEDALLRARGARALSQLLQCENVGREAVASDALSSHERHRGEPLPRVRRRRIDTRGVGSSPVAPGFSLNDCSGTPAANYFRDVWGLGNPAVQNSPRLFCILEDRH